MARRGRSNPLALAVLISLQERPMHPYEVATTLRQRHKHESVRLNYGSLYAVVESLARRNLIEAEGTDRAGRLPERTVYRLTPAGRVEMHGWLTELLAVPVKEYPAFEAALSFLPALPPDTVVALLEDRAARLELAIAEWRSTRELMGHHGLPRVLWVEGEFAETLRQAELEYVHRLAGDIRNGSLEGEAWWRGLHDERERRHRDHAATPDGSAAAPRCDGDPATPHDHHETGLHPTHEGRR